MLRDRTELNLFEQLSEQLLPSRGDVAGAPFRERVARFGHAGS